MSIAPASIFDLIDAYATAIPQGNFTLEVNPGEGTINGLTLASERLGLKQVIVGAHAELTDLIAPVVKDGGLSFAVRQDIAEADVLVLVEDDHTSTGTLTLMDEIYDHGTLDGIMLQGLVAVVRVVY